MKGPEESISNSQTICNQFRKSCFGNLRGDRLFFVENQIKEIQIIDENCSPAEIKRKVRTRTKEKEYKLILKKKYREIWAKKSKFLIKRAYYLIKLYNDDIETLADNWQVFSFDELKTILSYRELKSNTFNRNFTREEDHLLIQLAQEKSSDFKSIQKYFKSRSIPCLRRRYFCLTKWVPDSRARFLESNLDPEKKICQDKIRVMFNTLNSKHSKLLHISQHFTKHNQNSNVESFHKYLIRKMQPEFKIYEQKSLHIMSRINEASLALKAAWARVVFNFSIEIKNNLITQEAQSLLFVKLSNILGQIDTIVDNFESIESKLTEKFANCLEMAGILLGYDRAKYDSSNLIFKCLEFAVLNLLKVLELKILVITEIKKINYQLKT